MDERLKKFHKVSNRHFLIIETSMPSPDAHQIFALSNRVRKAGNELVNIINKNYFQLMRTKRYRKLLKLYGASTDKDLKKYYSQQLAEMQEQYNVTKEFCRKTMIPIAKKYNVPSEFGQSKAKHVWMGVMECLYKKGKTLHFSEFGDYPPLKANAINAAIPISFNEGTLSGKIRTGKREKWIKFGVKIKPNDRFQQDEIDAMLKYMSHPDTNDTSALNEWLNTGKVVDTYRPCYAMLVPKIIRRRYRVFLHLCIEGKAMPKFDRYGNPRNKYGKGEIRSDIDSQILTCNTKTKASTKYLAKRYRSLLKSEHQERLIMRKMERSRRATNPQNYNENKTIKKDSNVWHYSNRYKKLRYRYTNLCRKNAITRKLTINEYANYLRSIGNVFISEPKAPCFHHKSNPKSGLFKRIKRYGNFIQNRNYGYFQATVKKKFDDSGGTYIKAPENCQASIKPKGTPKKATAKKKRSISISSPTDSTKTLINDTKAQKKYYTSLLLYSNMLLNLPPK